MKCHKVSYHRLVPGNGGSAAAEPESSYVESTLWFGFVDGDSHYRFAGDWNLLCGRWFHG